MSLFRVGLNRSVMHLAVRIKASVENGGDPADHSSIPALGPGWPGCGDAWKLLSSIGHNDPQALSGAIGERLRDQV